MHTNIQYHADADTWIVHVFPESELYYSLSFATLADALLFVEYVKRSELLKCRNRIEKELARIAVRIKTTSKNVTLTLDEGERKPYEARRDALRKIFFQSKLARYEEERQQVMDLYHSVFANEDNASPSDQ